METQNLRDAEETKVWSERWKTELRVEPTPEELKKAIAELIEQVEQYFLFHPFSGAGIGNFRDPLIDIDEFASIDPQVMTDHGRFAELYDIVLKAIKGENEMVRYALWQLDSLRYGLSGGMGKVGYYVGLFMSARLMGASREQLEQLGKGLCISLLREEER
jgi:hypothetical protein